MTGKGLVVGLLITLKNVVFFGLSLLLLNFFASDKIVSTFQKFEVTQAVSFNI